MAVMEVEDDLRVGPTCQLVGERESRGRLGWRGAGLTRPVSAGSAQFNFFFPFLFSENCFCSNFLLIAPNELKSDSKI
jgi:hypothetical protein